MKQSSMLRRFFYWTVLSLVVIGSSVAQSAEVDAESAPAGEGVLASIRPDVHGFISQGYFKTSANNYLGNSKLGSFAFTEVGVNYSKSLTKNIDIGVQLFARKLGPSENFNGKFDWFFGGYNFSNWLKLKVGRIKIPFGLYNDSSDVDSARVPILLPQSIYPIQNRNFLLAHTGAQVSGFGDLGSFGSLIYHLYGGSIGLELPPITSTSLIITKIDTPYIFGGRLMWETPLAGLRTGLSVQDLRLDFDTLIGTTAVSAKIPATQYVGSLEFAYRRLLLSAEYSRWFVDLESSNPTFIPETRTISERYYIMTSYYLTESLSPGIYYSMLVPNVLKRDELGGHQDDWAFFLRYDFNQHWLLKLEGHAMSGTAALSPSLNNNTPLNALKGNWALFMVKTTVTF